MQGQQQYEMKGMDSEPLNPGAPPPQYPPPAAGYPPPAAGYPPPAGGYPTPAQQPLYPQTQTVVVSPQPVVMTREGDQVQDNMIIAIISIFFCCILGIIATFKANNAKNLKNQPGGLEQAKRESESARKLAIAAIITGCAIVFLTIFFTVILPIILGGVFAATAAATYDDDF